MLDKRLIDLATNAVGSPEQVVRATDAFFESAGFSVAVWASIDRNTLKPKCLVGAFTEDWMRHYFNEGFAAYDPWFDLVASRRPFFSFDFENRKTHFPNAHPKTGELLGGVADMGYVTSRFPGTFEFGDGLSGFNLWSPTGGAEVDRALLEWDREFRLGAAMADLAMHRASLPDLPTMHGVAPFAVYNISAPLSEREIEALKFLGDGLRNERIAEKMGISVPTVQFHFHNARRKLKAKTREQALAIAVATGILNL